MIQYFFDCALWLINFVFIFSCGFSIFYFFSFLKGIDDAQSFLGYVLLTKLCSYCILFSITCASVTGRITSFLVIIICDWFAWCVVTAAIYYFAKGGIMINRRQL